jgi:hypothetical protein
MRACNSARKQRILDRERRSAAPPKNKNFSVSRKALRVTQARMVGTAMPRDFGTCVPMRHAEYVVTAAQLHVRNFESRSDAITIELPATSE